MTWPDYRDVQAVCTFDVDVHQNKVFSQQGPFIPNYLLAANR